MDALGLTNEHLKEHLMTLCMDQKTVEAFDQLDSQSKAAFTREYNKQHKDDFTGKKGPAKGKGKAKSAVSKTEEEGGGDDEDEEEATAGGEKALLDEEQLQEIKKAKK